MMKPLSAHSYSRVSAVFLAVAITAAGLAQGNGPPPTPVRVDAVVQQNITERRLVSGELRPLRRAEVASEEAQRVEEVAVQEGQRVRAGDLLARLDNQRLEIERDILKAQYSAAGAATAEAEADRDYRRDDLAIMETAYKANGASDKELLDRRSALRVAEARLVTRQSEASVIEARLALLHQRLADLNITAPFDGVIAAVHVEPGEWLEEGGHVVQMVADTTLEAWLDVPQRFFTAVQEDPEAIRVVVDADEDARTPTRLAVIPLVNEDARTFTVIATLDNASGSLAAGMSVQGWAPSGQRGDHLTIMKDALLRNDAGAFVYVLRQMSADGPPQVVPARVTVLFPLDHRMAVQSTELRPGDRIVVEGNERLFPMTAVSPIEAETAAAPIGSSEPGTAGVGGNASP